MGQHCMRLGMLILAPQLIPCALRATTLGQLLLSCVLLRHPHLSLLVASPSLIARLCSNAVPHLCRLYVFEGSVRKSGGGKDALDVANLLLRGCTLRNTDWVTGLVDFAGFDSKIFKNRVLAPRKVGPAQQMQHTSPSPVASHLRDSGCSSSSEAPRARQRMSCAVLQCCRLLSWSRT